ncbi:MAG: ABC transporter permease [Bryobacterales bacterium]|nr:ABC transporter permease [Bryobacterales bacterium]
MITDLRQSLRMLLKQPGFTLIAVLNLALGIGATCAVFSLVQGVLLTPPPYRQPKRLALVHSLDASGKPSRQGWAALQWTEWQKEVKSLAGVAAYAWTFNFLIGNDGSESMEGMAVTREYFDVTGLRPILGRSFVEPEADGKTPSAVLIGYDVWQRKFNADPKIIGKTIRISRSAPATVIGVMPPGVRFLPSPGNAQEPNYNVNGLVQFWIPVTPKPAESKGLYWNVAVRLRDDATAAQAESELRTLIAREARAERSWEGFTPKIELLSDELNATGIRILVPLLGAAALVLLIACGNAAALLLVRGLQRQQEYAVRSALGVSRIVLFRQVATESLLLSLCGEVLAAGVTIGLVRLLKTIGGHAIPRLDTVGIGWTVLLFGLGAAVLSAMLAGLYPALRASRMDPSESLKSAGPKSSASRGERRLLFGVTMAQTALTLALLVGAGLLIRTMINLSQVQAGYDSTHILSMTVTAVQGDWMAFHQRALDRVAAVPGVRHAAFAWGVPLTGNNWPVPTEIEGQPVPAKASDRIVLPFRAVTPDFFQVMGFHVIEGRGFRSTDTENHPQVAVVNQAFADRYFPRGQALGRKFWMAGHTLPGGRPNPGGEIVGVVANARTDDLARAAEPEIYLCFWQMRAFSKDLVVRTAGDPRALMVKVQRELHAVDPTAAVENVKTFDQIRDDSLASRTFAMNLLVGFSIVGSVLTLVGLYGVISLSVTSRRRELAIRTAVGAQQRHIHRLILGEGFRLIAGGVVAGLAIALMLSRVLKSFLFGVEPADPLTLLGVGAVFAVVAMLACWVPTRRAADVNPLEALRYE